MSTRRRPTHPSPVIWYLRILVAGWLGCVGCENSDGSNTGTTALIDVTQVASGDLHSCALRANGTVVCWGSNRYGQIGAKSGDSSFEILDTIGLATEASVDYQRYARVVEGLSDVRLLEAGGYHTCALRKDGAVRCWGESDIGQLGNGDFSLSECDGTPCSRRPVEAKGLKNVQSLALGAGLSCAVHTDGRLSCWGGSAVGVDPATLARCDRTPCATEPVLVPTEAAVSEVAVAGTHACLIDEGGSVACWGNNRYGQIGTAKPPFETVQNVSILLDVDRPTKVTLPGHAVALFMTQNANTSCARLEDRSLYCWGQNDLGQLGAGVVDQACATGLDSKSACAITPQKLIVRGDDVARYLIGTRHGCALTRARTLSCWGLGTDGQLGVKRELLRPCESGGLCASTPVAFSTSTPVIDAALGPDITCLLDEAENVRCYGWGYRENVANIRALNAIDCTSQVDGCVVTPSWHDTVSKLVLTHLNRMCVLTHRGELHCLTVFNPLTGNIESEPIQVRQ